MFVNGVEVISYKLDNINLNIQRNMQPKAERPPICPKGQLPLLQLTPPGANKKSDGSPQIMDNPSLLKPQHDIPPTPPPQADRTLNDFFPQRIG